MKEDILSKIGKMKIKRNELEAELGLLNEEIMLAEADYQRMMSKDPDISENWNRELEGVAFHNEPEPKFFERERIFD